VSYPRAQWVCIENFGASEESQFVSIAYYRVLLTVLRSLLASLTMLTLVFAASAVATTLKNITITVPDGTSDHGNPNLLCTPTKWTDIVIFFLGNYLAHAATVIALPGESAVSMGMNALLALVLPWSGVNRGISAISICAKRGRTALQTAQRAQALCSLPEQLIGGRKPATPCQIVY
jgi:hypothetical protein